MRYETLGSDLLPLTVSLPHACFGPIASFMAEDRGEGQEVRHSCHTENTNPLHTETPTVHRQYLQSVSIPSILCVSGSDLG